MIADRGLDVDTSAVGENTVQERRLYDDLLNIEVEIIVKARFNLTVAAFVTCAKDSS